MSTAADKATDQADKAWQPPIELSEHWPALLRESREGDVEGVFKVMMFLENWKAVQQAVKRLKPWKKPDPATEDWSFLPVTDPQRERIMKMARKAKRQQKKEERFDRENPRPTVKKSMASKGGSMTRKSEGRLTIDLLKAGAGSKPPGSGWQPIPGGKKGGARRGAPGSYQYWYPGVGITSSPHADDAAAAKKPAAKPAGKPGEKPKPEAKPGEKPEAKPAEEKPTAAKQAAADGKVITDPGELPEGFNDLPKDQRAVMTADWGNVSEQMSERFGEPKKYEGDLKAAISSHVDELASHGWIVPTNADRAKEMLHAQLEHGKKAGVDEAVLGELMEANTRKLAHQEIEAARRTLGDHGVRHLAVNGEQGDKIFDALEKAGTKVEPMDRFMARQVWIDHDMGYTVSAIAQGGFAVKDNYHPQASTVLAIQQGDVMGKAFGKDGVQKYVDAVANHSGSDVDWKADPFGSAVRLADNTHLFADKMPEVLFDSPAAVEAMVKIQMAGQLIPGTGGDGKRTPEEKARFKTLIAGVKENLSKEIRKREDLPDKTKEALLNATKELGALTPKFLISRLAGRSPEFEFDKKTGHMVVNIEQSDARHTIGEVFGEDEEDKQFQKLLKDYGTDPKSALDTKPPPPKAIVAKEGKGGLDFRWTPPKDEHPAERRHAEIMKKHKAEFDKLKGAKDGDEAMNAFFGVEVAKSITAALDAWENDMEKAGEGSRGGKIIGRTKTGKPIYESGAAKLHRELKGKKGKKMKEETEAKLKRMGKSRTGEEGMDKGLCVGRGANLMDWAYQFESTGLYSQALTCLKDLAQCNQKTDQARKEHPSYEQLEELPKAQRERKRRDYSKRMSTLNEEREAIQAKMSALEVDFYDAKIKEAKSMNKGVRVGGVIHHLAEDEALAKSLEDGGLQVGVQAHVGDGRPTLRKAIQTGGTIYEGELIEHDNPGNDGDNREEFQRRKLAATIIEDDPAGNHGVGGLAEWYKSGQRQTATIDDSNPDANRGGSQVAGWFKGTYDPQQRGVNVPLGSADLGGMAKAEEPPTVVIDDSDPYTRAIHRQQVADGGAAIDFIYHRDAKRS
jgi:hypothetical protein